MVYLTEISGVEAQENYTLIRLRDGESALVRRSMSDWEEALPRQYFMRTHRSLIVNVHEITKVSKHSRAEMSIAIKGFPSLFAWDGGPAPACGRLFVSPISCDERSIDSRSSRGVPLRHP